jgi:tRNA(Ile)-lysidine synthase
VPDAHPEASLPVPGTVAWPPAAVMVMAAVADRRAVNASPAVLGPSSAMVDADAVGRRLVVRAWQAGDVMRPIGLGGSQKLQDAFVNRKVPRPDRARVPVVTMPDGRIVWVVGFAVDEAFAVSEATNRVVILKATHPGGRA